MAFTAYCCRGFTVFAKFTHYIMRETNQTYTSEGMRGNSFRPSGTVRKDVGQRYEEELSRTGSVSYATLVSLFFFYILKGENYCLTAIAIVKNSEKKYAMELKKERNVNVEEM